MIATAIEEFSTTINEVANKTQQTAESAKLADSQAHSGLGTVQNSYQSIESLAAEIDGLAEKITGVPLQQVENPRAEIIDILATHFGLID